MSNIEDLKKIDEDNEYFNSLSGYFCDCCSCELTWDEYDKYTFFCSICCRLSPN